MSELINNIEHRQKMLKKLIKDLHEGRPFDEVKAEFETHFSEVSTSEISALEQALMKDGMPLEEVQRLCDVHAALFDGSIADIHPSKDQSAIPGHPLNIFLREAEAIDQVIAEEIKPHLQDFLETQNKMSHLMVRVGFDRLAEVHLHFARKENLFFPILERYGITGPPKVMWGIDDEIRSEIKAISAQLSHTSIDYEKLNQNVHTTLAKVTDMLFKERNILIPLLTETFNLLDWINIDEASSEYALCLIEQGASWKVDPIEKDNPDDSQIEGHITLDAGTMTREEVNAIFNTLPLDMTFVDCNDKVKWFSQGEARIFERPKTILGRDVSMCHPPASVHIVEKIVDSFKSGQKSHEDFWIQLGDRFVHIRYYAVRGTEGQYLGTLEITQDIKPLRDLEGEKRLLSDD